MSSPNESCTLVALEPYSDGQRPKGQYREARDGYIILTVGWELGQTQRENASIVREIQVW
jgi:hypothetical protein